MKNNNFIERITAADLMAGNYTKEECIITPNVLRASSRLALVGSPKIGKSDFLLHWMVHMAAGVPFIGMKPICPMNVLYIQTEIEEPYFKERLQSIDENILSLADDNLTFYLPEEEISLDDQGIKKIAKTVNEHLKIKDIDIIVIEALFYEGCLKFYRGTQSEESFSFKRALNNLWKQINPMAGLIFSYSFDKSTKTLPDEIPICDFDKILMHQSHYEDDRRQLTFDIMDMKLNGAEFISSKTVSKVNNKWIEVGEGGDCVESK